MPSLISPLIAPLQAGAIDTALNNLIHRPNGNGDQVDARQAMSFTSSARRRILLNLADQISEVKTAQKRSFEQTLQIPQNPNQIPAGTLGSREDLLSLNEQLDKALPVISMAINPNSVEFDQPKRYARQDVQRGTVFHHFTNNQGQNNDVMTIRFQGNTGNISRNTKDQVALSKAIDRLQIWHNLYQLTREPILLSDGSTNIFYVSYYSPLFPVNIEFAGFFTQVLKFTENAKKPNSRDYSMEFIVQSTSPDLNTIHTTILDFVTQQAVATPSNTSTNLSSTGF